jgi:transcriptional regulator with XRE-family HTH domain
MELREARRRAADGKGITQEQLAELSELDQPTISALENKRIARPSHFVVVKVIRGLRAGGLADITSEQIDEFAVADLPDAAAAALS